MKTLKNFLFEIIFTLAFLSLMVGLSYTVYTDIICTLSANDLQSANGFTFAVVLFVTYLFFIVFFVASLTEAINDKLERFAFQSELLQNEVSQSTFYIEKAINEASNERTNRIATFKKRSRLSQGYILTLVKGLRRQLNAEKANQAFCRMNVEQGKKATKNKQGFYVLSTVLLLLLASCNEANETKQGQFKKRLVSHRIGYTVQTKIMYCDTIYKVGEVVYTEFNNYTIIR